MKAIGPPTLPSLHGRLGLCVLLLTLGGCAGLPRPTQPVPSPPPAQAASTAPVMPSSDPRQRFVTAALSMRGRPYRYGGADPAGFDCSGLVDYAARSAGLKVPRTTAEQWRAGTAVKRGALQTGDLVFMRLDKGLHVGIVTEPGVFVHAPSTGGQVRLDRLDAPPYRKGFIGGRRIEP